ncbi:MAG: GGDEF domain-containing protein [Hahellaceae bacterium]|nr:GGDEF domain-containing protein [Hahellaceae bacterium]
MKHAPYLNTSGSVFIRELKSRYISIGVKLFSLLSVYVSIISVVRSVDTGWLNLYTFQIVLAVLFLGLNYFSKYLSDNLKVLALVGIAFVAGVAGITTFGLLGSGFYYFILSGLFLSIFFSRRWAYVSVVAGSLVVGVTGYMHTQGWLDFDVDATSYMRNQASWWTVIFGPFVVSGFLMFIIGDIRNKLMETMITLEESQHEIQRLSLHDTQCDLPNLRAFEQHYEAIAVRPDMIHQDLAVLLVDLDHFRQVNQRFGHMEGDFVLKDIASRLKYCIGDYGFVARLGGDEFILLLEDLPDGETSVNELINKLFGVIRHPSHMANGERVTLTASMGCVILPPNVRAPLQQVLMQSDRRLQAAKEGGGNRLQSGLIEG